LEHLIDTCFASELVGAAKPEAAIFHLAAERCGLGLAGAWMVGDNPAKDIVAAAQLGLNTAWVSRRRDWPSHIAPPTVVGETFPDTVEQILGPS
jgi:putative hydrolase of the HAD superfamily